MGLALLVWAAEWGFYCYALLETGVVALACMEALKGLPETPLLSDFMVSTLNWLSRIHRFPMS